MNPYYRCTYHDWDSTVSPSECKFYKKAEGKGNYKCAYYPGRKDRPCRSVEHNLFWENAMGGRGINKRGGRKKKHAVPKNGA